jgi:hypothetical protein
MVLALAGKSHVALDVSLVPYLTMVNFNAEHA